MNDVVAEYFCFYTQISIIAKPLFSISMRAHCEAFCPQRRIRQLLTLIGSIQVENAVQIFW